MADEELLPLPAGTKIISEAGLDILRRVEAMVQEQVRLGAEIVYASDPRSADYGKALGVRR